MATGSNLVPSPVPSTWSAFCAHPSGQTARRHIGKCKATVQATFNNEADDLGSAHATAAFPGDLSAQAANID